MKKKIQDRNWALVITASLVIVLNAALLVFSILYAKTIGWWSIAVIVGALSSIILSSEAIRRNDPALLLLDLLFPS